MNRHIKSILPLASILILLVSACDAQYLDAGDSAGTPETGLPAAAQIETRPTPTPEGDVGDADQVLTLESIQTPIAPTGPEEAVSDVDPEDIPSPEELDAILDRVNRGGPERPGSDGAVGEGPAPETESVMGPMNVSSSLDPEHILSEKERDTILDRVNRGAPELPRSDEEVGEGLEPGTESGMGPMNDTEDVDLENTPSEAEDTDRHFLIRLIEALRNWLQEFFS